MSISFEEFAQGGSVRPVQKSSVPEQAQSNGSGGFGGFIREVQQKFGKRASDLGEARASGQSPISSALQALGQTAAFVGQDVPAAAVRRIPGVQAAGDAIGTAVQQNLEPVAPLISNGASLYDDWKTKNPEDARNLEATLNIASLLPIGAGTKKAAELGAEGVEAVAKGAKKTAQAVAEKPAVQGMVQIAKDNASKVPRFTGRVREGVLESAAKAERLRTAAPEVAQAVKAGVDDRLIRTIETVDRATPQGTATLKGYKDMVRIAEDAGTKIGVKERPEIVAGKAVEDQFKLLESQRKSVGEQIGNAVDDLSRKITVNMSDSIDTLRAVLAENGITTKGKDLSFSGTKYTAKERAGIRELWDEAIRSGESLTPRQIYDADSLFSKLQRESRLDGIGDIFVRTPDGDMPLFSVFRDVFSDKLDEIAPDVRPLNSQYRELARLKEDIEDSLIKGGNFNVTKGMDTSNFAQTNLRRMTSDAQSAAAYREIAGKLEGVARALGYEGASSRDLIDFATELRNIFPDSVPATGFTGILQRSGSIPQFLGEVMGAGKPGITDQQRALKQLLETISSE